MLFRRRAPLFPRTVKGQQVAASAFVDQDFYFSIYPDVAASGMTAETHYARHGHTEGRNPNPFFHTTFYRTRYLIEDPNLTVNPLIHYVSNKHQIDWVHPVVSLAFIAKHYGLDAGTDTLGFILANSRYINRICSWFDIDYYRRIYNDELHGSDPLHHFLRNASSRDLYLSSDILARPRRNIQVDDLTAHYGIERLELPDAHVFLFRRRFNNSVYRQILEQASFDRGVFAVGPEAVKGLRVVAADDLKARDAFDAQAFCRCIRRRVDFLIFLPALRIGGAEKYAAGLVDLASDCGLHCCVITEQSKDEDLQSIHLDSLAGMRRATLISLKDYSQNYWRRDSLLATIVAALKPTYTVNINSDHAFRMIARHGRFLRNFTTLYTAFFSESPNSVEAPYASRYFPLVAEFARCLTDNQAAANAISERTPVGWRKDWVVLPQVVELSTVDQVVRSHKLRLTLNEGSRPRVLWFSRADPFKCVELLEHIALGVPEADFDAIGPGLEDRSPALASNLRFYGAVPGISSVHLDNYELFMFTSRFEGMPNTVLEVASHGLPIVASDVGGLRETFSEQSVRFVSMDGSDDDIVASFAGAIRALLLEPSDIRLRRSIGLRNDVANRHSRDGVLRMFQSLILDGKHGI